MISGYSVTKGLPKPKIYHLWNTHNIDEVKIYICNATYNQSMPSYRRMVSFLHYALLATIAGLIERRVDLVFATSTPLTVVIPGVILSKLKRKPYVFEARDLWPEDSVAAGWMVEGSLIHRFLSYLERITYKHARQISVVSKGFYDRLIDRGIPKNKMNLNLLGADAELYEDVKINTEFFKSKGIQDKKIAVYTGAHGKTNGLFQLLDAADYLRDRDDLAIVFLGRGSERSNLIKGAKERKLDNLHFFDPVPGTELVKLLAACHMGLVIFKQVSRPRWLTPNKLFDYCFSGLPIIVNFEGTTADLVTMNRIGRVSEPGCAKSLAEAIAFYLDNEDVRASDGARARELAIREYDRAIIAESFEAMLLRAASSGSNRSNE